MFTTVYSSVNLSLPVFSRACLRIFTPVYSCLPMFTRVCLRLPMFTRVYICDVAG